MSEFRSFSKIARLSRDMVITEKLDGTNAQVLITPFVSGDLHDSTVVSVIGTLGTPGQTFSIRAGSRNRWLTPEDDNFSFAGWVRLNAECLVGLGEGRHFGEWWGSGIQRRYGLTEKRFSLFNVGRWRDASTPTAAGDTRELCPACCHTVPKLYEGPFDTNMAMRVLVRLGESGSVAADGFEKPEGIVVYHTGKTGALFKKTFEDDEKGKGQ